MLGDAAGFASGDGRGSDAVQNRGLTMVNVTHDNDDRRPRNQPIVFSIVKRSLPR